MYTLLLLINPPQQWAKSEIFEYLESHIATNENIEYHYQDNNIWIGEEKVLKRSVFEENIDNPRDNDILKEIIYSIATPNMDIVLKDLVRYEDHDKEWEDNKWIIEDGIGNQRELKVVVNSENQEKEEYIKTNEQCSLRMEKEMDFFRKCIDRNNRKKSNHNKYQRRRWSKCYNGNC